MKIYIRKQGLTKAIFTFISICYISIGFAQAPISVGLKMRSLLCNKTTEAGEDEVYILVNGKSPTGKWNFRLPGSNTHWDLNDGNGQRQITDWFVATDNTGLKPNETSIINIAIMEEDGGTVGQLALDAAGKALEECSASGDPYCIAGALGVSIANALHLGQDTDDYIGGFTVSMSRDENGAIHLQYYNFDRCSIFQEGSQQNFGMTGISFSGDGSQYVAYFQLYSGGQW